MRTIVYVLASKLQHVEILHPSHAGSDSHFQPDDNRIFDRRYAISTFPSLTHIVLSKSAMLGIGSLDVIVEKAVNHLISLDLCLDENNESLWTDPYSG